MKYYLLCVYMFVLCIKRVIYLRVDVRGRRKSSYPDRRRGADRSTPGRATACSRTSVGSGYRFRL